MTITQALLIIFGVFIFVGSVAYVMINVVMGCAGEPTDDHPFIFGLVMLVFGVMLICMSGVR